MSRSFLTPIRMVGRNRQSQAFWLYKCACGTEKIILACNVKSRNTISCGCVGREMKRKAKTSHGLSGTSTYECWGGVVKRCANVNNHAYRRYGGRGIHVCDRWLKFENFLADMGRRPSPAHSIDRVDNDGHYEPGNCRWATRSEQSRNRSDNRLVSWCGETLTLTDLAAKAGMPEPRLRARIDRYGWNLERALSAPKYSKQETAR